MKRLCVLIFGLLLLIAACDTELGHFEDHDHDGDGVQDHAAEHHDEDEHYDEHEGELGEEDSTSSHQDSLSIATFAGGCFWCVESDFEHVSGVKEVISGFSGGEGPATYKQVSSGETSHREVVQVYFNQEEVSYEDLLNVFWRSINPTDAKGQFVDRGFQYTSAIFYHDEQQKELAEKSKQELEQLTKFDDPIVTPIIEFKSFYEAEEYHQDYYKKNPIRYKFYRSNSGRDKFLEKVWS